MGPQRRGHGRSARRRQLRGRGLEEAKDDVIRIRGHRRASQAWLPDNDRSSRFRGARARLRRGVLGTDQSDGNPAPAAFPLARQLRPCLDGLKITSFYTFFITSNLGTHACMEQ
jgi:hypothetical protein